jgi:hypothetical protein
MIEESVLSTPWELTERNFIVNIMCVGKSLKEYSAVNPTGFIKRPQGD